MAVIKNIIFDLGGVLLQIDYQKTEESFVALGVKNFSKYFKQDFVSKLFDDFETGKISTNIFYNKFRTITKNNLTNLQIKNAWNAMLLTFWQNRLVWVESISTKYNIFLLSNTNEIHYNEVINIYNKSNSLKPFSSYFIKDYYSHILGLRKPIVSSYLKVIEEQHLLATETLFIDDTLKNIEGAKQASLQVLHLLPSMDLVLETIRFLENNKQLNKEIV